MWWLDRKYKEKDDDHCLESWIYFWFQLVFYPPTKVFYPLRLLHIVIKVMYEGIGFPCLFLVWSLSKRRDDDFKSFLPPSWKVFYPICECNPIFKFLEDREQWWWFSNRSQHVLRPWFVDFLTDVIKEMNFEVKDEIIFGKWVTFKKR